MAVVNVIMDSNTVLSERQIMALEQEFMEQRTAEYKPQTAAMPVISMAT